MAADLPEDVIQLQRTAHAAWAAVEDHRKAVDARRRADAAGGPLRPWTPGEDARHEQLMAAVRQAQQDLHAAVDAEEGLDRGYEIVQGLHKAARPEA